MERGTGPRFASLDTARVDSLLTLSVTKRNGDRGKCLQEVEELAQLAVELMSPWRWRT